MPSIVNTNMNALVAQNKLSANQSSLATAVQRLSSGLRINSARDDAAGLAISQRMRAQINGSNQAARNANDAISLAQTAQGALSQIGTNLQRMRELAVQSANGTNSASDRAALNNEVQALSAEINRMAQSANFNGVNLLDGSFNAQTFQVGANATAHDSITVNQIASARTSALGGAGSSYCATVPSGTTTTALSAGDLTLNGIQVGASSQGAAAGQSAASAFSIAAAINAVSSTSGVTAAAQTNTVAGTGAAITSLTRIAANTFSINGVNIGIVAGGGTAAGQGANVAAAINLVAGQSGVTASADATSGALTLSAADGRDISIAINGVANGVTAGDQATAAALAKTTLMAQTGLASGVVGTQATAGVAGGAPVAATTGALGVFTPAGYIGFGSNPMSYLTTDIWLDIPGVGRTGVLDYSVWNMTATCATMAQRIDYFFGSISGGSYQGFTVDYGGQPSSTLALSAGTLSFSRADGVNFSVYTTVDLGNLLPAATPGFARGTVTTTDGHIGAGVAAVAGVPADNHGSLTLSSTSSSGIVWSGGHAAYAGLAASGSQGATTTASVSSIASMDVLTSASATAALATIDGALASVNASRAALGAMQNSFTSVVASLQAAAQNLTASLSRIQDADFAAETAQWSRAQILQHAALAMVAQANAGPRVALLLLR